MQQQRWAAGAQSIQSRDILSRWEWWEKRLVTAFKTNEDVVYGGDSRWVK